MKKLVWVVAALLLLGVLAAVIFFSKEESVLESRFRQELESLTGAKVSFEGFQSYFLRGESSSDGKTSGPLLFVGIENLKLLAPEGFREEILAEARNIQMVLEPLPLVRGFVKFKKLSLNVTEIHFEMNGQGELNLLKLTPLKQETLDRPFSLSQRFRGPFVADRVEMKLGIAFFHPFAVVPEVEGEEVPLESFDLKGRPQVYDQVTDFSVLIQAPVLEMLNEMNKGSLGLSRGKIQEFMNRNMGPIQNQQGPGP